MESLRAAYDQKIADSALRPDAAQAGAVAALERLEGELTQRPGFFRKAATPRGVYLWGPVGRGKSMVMDLFFRTAPVEAKRRVHFQTFMREVHAAVDAWRRGDPAARKARFGRSKGDDPIEPVAGLIAHETRLLCFDELQVTDIADAMILGRLFQALFERGVVLVSTSNRPPEDLYKDGLNRQLFTPFIDLLKARQEVVAVRGPVDFRLDRLRGAQVWFSPADKSNRVAFDRLWSDLTEDEGERETVLEIQQRSLVLARTVGGFVRATFAELCDQPLGAGDYLAIADRFHTVFLDSVPQLGPEKRNAARRLVHLIDALYEASAKLVVLADAEPDGLYPAGDGAFEFERTASRLHEMRSASYLERARD